MSYEKKDDVFFRTGAQPVLLFTNAGSQSNVVPFPSSHAARVSAAQEMTFIWSTVVSNIFRAYRCSTARPHQLGTNRTLPDAPLTTAASRRRPVGEESMHPPSATTTVHST